MESWFRGENQYRSRLHYTIRLFDESDYEMYSRGNYLGGVVCDSLAVRQNTDGPCRYLVSRSFKGHISILVIMTVADEAGGWAIVRGVLCRLHWPK
jgi:hypothetical protein